MVADFLTAVRSLKQIHEAIASKDEALLEAVLREEEDNLQDEFDLSDGDELEEFNDELSAKREQYHQFLISDTPAALEPGSTIFAIQHIIDRHGLEIDLNLDFNIGYPHTVWQAYLNIIGESLDTNATQLIEHLEARPFRGREVEFDGTIYGWITLDEVSVLHDALAPLEIQELLDDSTDGSPVRKFHSDLIDALVQLQSQGCDALVVAC